MVKFGTCEIPFGLIYETLAVNPIEIVITSHNVQLFNPRANDMERQIDINLANEKWWRKSKQKLGLPQPVTSIGKQAIANFLLKYIYLYFNL